MRLPLHCTKCRTNLPLAAYDALTPVPCTFCGQLSRAVVFPAFFRTAEVVSTENLMDDSEGGCFYHPAKKASVACDGCGRFICQLCEVDLEDSKLCPQCIESGRRKGKLTSLEKRRTLYDDIAFLLSLAFLPVATWVFTICTAPAALYICIRFRNEPSSLVRTTRWRWWVALVLSILQICAWLGFVMILIAGWKK